MLDKKQRLFRLIENYINDFQGESVQKIYGEGSKIKVHSMTQSFSTNILLFEVVVVLGETINESVMDDSLANVLIQDSLVYFFPECQIKTYVRFDV
jgi:uncharacterized protein YpmS